MFKHTVLVSWKNSKQTHLIPEIFWLNRRGEGRNELLLFFLALLVNYPTNSLK